MSHAQSIEKFSIDSGGASATAGGIQVLYTIGEVNVAERTSASVALSEGFITESVRIKINVAVFLQGPLLNPATPGLMNDILREDNLLPTTSPYPDGLTTASSVFSTTGDNAIVDWIYVELRSKADNTNVVSACSALLQRDGDIVAIDGISDLVMAGTKNDYYIVVKHRNHLAAMSDAVIALSEVPTVVNFTDSAFTTYGDNARALLGSGVMALWSGDTNNSNQVRFSGTDNTVNPIRDYVLADPLNLFDLSTFESSGYLNIDVDMNGMGRFSGTGADSNIIRNNALAHPGNLFNITTYKIDGTVPSEN